MCVCCDRIARACVLVYMDVCSARKMHAHCKGVVRSECKSPSYLCIWLHVELVVF